MKEILYQLWLVNLPKVSNSVARLLYEYYGSFKAVYELDAERLEQNREVSNQVKQSLLYKDLTCAEKILESCERLGAKIISMYDEGYPGRLREISDPPMQLYVKGKLPDIDNMLAIAVVGARRCSVYGANSANLIAHDLAKAGALVISGMARGVDSSAHRGALKAGGETVAVLGCGIDVVYPPENKELKKIIEANGAVITEFPPGTPPNGSNFPSRNRIISGLSNATVIIEGRATSGSTITARLALDQGREVFCLPGNVDNTLSTGPNMLIREGGRLITCAKDIVTDLSTDYPEMMVETVFSEQSIKKRTEKLTEDQKKIISVMMANHPVHIDQICYKTKIEVAVVNQCLFTLELEGMVRQLPGKNYILQMA